MIAAILRWWKQRNCEHYWRPALIGKYIPLGHRYCDYCEKAERLSDAEFYAQFGRIPIL